MERQRLLFGEPDPPRPSTGGAARSRTRRHRPRAGELGVALVPSQLDVVDWALEDLSRDEHLRGHEIPIRVDDVLHLPRDLEIVAALIDRLDERLEAAAVELLETSPERARLLAWRRPAGRLAQRVHEWWIRAE